MTAHLRHHAGDNVLGNPAHGSGSGLSPLPASMSVKLPDTTPGNSTQGRPLFLLQP